MNSSVRVALEALEPQAREARATVADLQVRLAEAIQTADRLSSVVENLYALLGEEAPGDASASSPAAFVGASTLGSASAKPGYLTGSSTPGTLSGSGILPGSVANTTGIVPVVDQDGLDFGVTARRKVRSTELVAHIVANAEQPIHRDEVIRTVTQLGAAEGMKNPRNAINTALLRAVRAGLIVQLGPGDRFVRPGFQSEQPPKAEPESPRRLGHRDLSDVEEEMRSAESTTREEVETT